MIKYFVYKFFMILKFIFQDQKFKINKLNNKCIPKDSSVVIGNGPSLTYSLENHIDFFVNKDLYVVNDFSLSPFFTILKPEFYVLIDPAYWFPDKLCDSKKACLENLFNVDWKMNLILPIDANKSFHSRFFNHPNVNIYYFPNIYIGNLSNLPFLYHHNFFNPQIQNVLVYTIFLSINNNNKAIFLLGAEHSWFNNLHVDESNTVCALDEHFYESDVKIEPYLTWYGEKYKLHQLLFDFGRMFRGYHELEAYSKRRGAKIVNLTKKSFIDAFDKINF